jgi:predicted alpha/beta-hydrolase family hydrolase
MTELAEWTNKKGKKVMRYPVLYGKARRQEKREQASERQVGHNKLSLKEKAARAVPNGKEHKRLLTQIEKDKE